MWDRDKQRKSGPERDPKECHHVLHPCEYGAHLCVYDPLSSTALVTSNIIQIDQYRPNRNRGSPPDMLQRTGSRSHVPLSTNSLSARTSGLDGTPVFDSFPGEIWDGGNEKEHPRHSETLPGQFKSIYKSRTKNQAKWVMKRESPGQPLNHLEY